VRRDDGSALERDRVDLALGEELELPGEAAHSERTEGLSPRPIRNIASGELTHVSASTIVAREMRPRQR
jgi:hypothetical protein